MTLHMSMVLSISEEFFVDVIGMPIGAIQSFLAVAREQSAEV
jgi:hypothetical protein